MGCPPCARSRRSYSGSGQPDSHDGRVSFGTVPGSRGRSQSRRQTFRAQRGANLSRHVARQIRTVGRSRKRLSAGGGQFSQAVEESDGRCLVGPRPLPTGPRRSPPPLRRNKIATKKEYQRRRGAEPQGRSQRQEGLPRNTRKRDFLPVRLPCIRRLPRFSSSLKKCAPGWFSNKNCKFFVITRLIFF